MENTARPFSYRIVFYLCLSFIIFLKCLTMRNKIVTILSVSITSLFTTFLIESIINIYLRFMSFFQFKMKMIQNKKEKKTDIHEDKYWRLKSRMCMKTNGNKVKSNEKKKRKKRIGMRFETR